MYLTSTIYQCRKKTIFVTSRISNFSAHKEPGEIVAPTNESASNFS